MDEIAPEYDVVVLGTGELHSHPHLTPQRGAMTAIIFGSEIVTQIEMLISYRFDRVYSFWVRSLADRD